jgi:hypothetical protein
MEFEELTQKLVRVLKRLPRAFGDVAEPMYFKTLVLISLMCIVVSNANPNAGFLLLSPPGLLLIFIWFLALALKGYFQYMEALSD